MSDVKIDIKENKYGFNIDDFVVMGSRANNPKRNFLFISKVLGKHLEVKPDVCKATGFLLAHLVYENQSPFNTDIFKNYLSNPVNKNNAIKEEMKKYVNPKENVLVMGFAETATGLGMSVACAIKDSYYVTTTRERIMSIKSFFNFEEEHSHATSHRCYLQNLDKLKNADRIILVDDEITTGNTMLNLIKELYKVSKAKKYTILSILDWRNPEYLDKYEKFNKEINLDIEVKSIISGHIESLDNTVYTGDNEYELAEELIPVKLNVLDKETHLLEDGGTKEYLKSSGRFGVSYNKIRELEEAAKELANKLKEELFKDNKVLILGHGENIYIPSRVASFFDNADFKTTSRSPIFVKEDNQYSIRDRYFFDVEGVKYHLYNKREIEKKYDKVLLITEDKIKTKLTNNMDIIHL